ncbi:MAG: HNH endonuclease [Firmicutes bacterium]|jgi:CRISPR-associated endonuclease Csn1|nr:HNH endonuclease [Bacillota bacterium]
MSSNYQINNLPTWRLGVDVGQNSIGFAAVAFDGEKPTEILSAVSWIHDGGADPDGQVPKSRKSTSGVARRTRKLRKRRRQRLKKLRQELANLGIPTPSLDDSQTYEPWLEREVLVRGRIDNEKIRNECLGRAFMHMARHRGWRNPWISVERLADLQTPSEPFTRMRDMASERFNVPVESIVSIGCLGALAAKRQGTRMRPRTTLEGSIPAKEKIIEDKIVFFERIRQEDIYEEIGLICQTQGLDKERERKIKTLILFQEHPYVKAESVGRDPFNPHEQRASKGTLEFQEFRVLDKVANLRIKSGGEKKFLPRELTEKIVSYLLNYQDDRNPTWFEVGEALDFDATTLVLDGFGDPTTQKAPVDDSTRKFLSAKKKLPNVYQWWSENDRIKRADFIAFLADPVDQEEKDVSDEIGNLFESLPDEEILELDKLSFSAGRSAYGRSTLQRLNEEMMQSSCDLTIARQKVFGVERYWTPPKDTFDIQTGQPTVDRNLALVRRFLSTATMKWGVPERVVVEHSRNGFMTPEKARLLQAEQAKREKMRNQYREELKAQGIENPSRRDILRQQLMQIQNSCCTYCGSELSWKGSEIDHIVPRASGGSSKQSNLMLVCLQCNREKSRQPFGRFAQNNPRVSLKDAIERVKKWERLTNLSAKEFGNYKKDVISRLSRLSDDEQLDERSMESTAYAAVALRERVESFLEKQPNYDPNDHSVRVHVYNGRVTSLARKVSGIEASMSLRGDNEKVRIDRRHHAVDALTLTTITPSVARVLIQRDEMRSADQMRWEPTKDYKSYYGALGDKINFERWLSNAYQLADLGRKLLDRDGIPVCRQLRLRPQHGAVHQDTVSKLEHKLLGEEFSENELKRIVDRRVYAKLYEEWVAEGVLQERRDRSVYCGKGKNLDSKDVVELFPKQAAMMKVQNGAVELNYIHHARVYAWREKQAIRFGLIRVFLGELATMGFHRLGVDILTAEIPYWSESYRLADKNVIQHIQDGSARQIGWLAVGDEVVFPKNKPLPGSSKQVEKFAQVFPDYTWTLAGFPSGDKLRLRPNYLAPEGVPQDLEPEVKEIVSGRGWWPSISVALGGGGYVIRRTVLGAPRWHADGHLPSSWNPMQVALTEFGL